MLLDQRNAKNGRSFVKPSGTEDVVLCTNPRDTKGAVKVMEGEELKKELLHGELAHRMKQMDFLIKYFLSENCFLLD
jgi:hypothetical protein